MNRYIRHLMIGMTVVFVLLATHFYPSFFLPAKQNELLNAGNTSMKDVGTTLSEDAEFPSPVIQLQQAILVGSEEFSSLQEGALNVDLKALYDEIPYEDYVDSDEIVELKQQLSKLQKLQEFSLDNERNE